MASHIFFVFRFLETVQSLLMYGVHYFSVKVSHLSHHGCIVSLHYCVFIQDKKECPKWLGIGMDGVMQFNYEDKQSCTRVCTSVNCIVYCP